jgi:hypothetical protein
VKDDGNYDPAELPKKLFLFIDLEDLIASGRLHVVAEHLGSTVGEALAVCVAVWSVTQSRGLVKVARVELERLIKVKVKQLVPRLSPAKVVDAMIDGDLATTENELYRIKGNDKQLAKLADIKTQRSKAGKNGNAVRWRKNPTKSDTVPSQPIAGVSQPIAGVSQPIAGVSQPIAPFLSNKERTKKDLPAAPLVASIEDSSAPVSAPADQPRSSGSSLATKEEFRLASLGDPAIVQPPPSRSRRTQEQQERSKRVNALFRRRYAEQDPNGEEPGGWDVSVNARIAKFSDKWGTDAEPIVNQFFDSADPYYKRSGYPVELMIAQAPKLNRERKSPQAHAESVGYQARSRVVSAQAQGALAVDEYMRRRDNNGG